MKKLTFAFACASTLALFAAPVATFEGVAPGFTGLSGKTDAGENGNEVYWQYMGASGSEDGSVVTAYGGENLPAPTGPQLSGTPGSNYLNLSTEGGTLWRSVNPNSADLGAAQNIDDAKGLFIDTMVQFTATEDGGTPEVAQDENGNYIDKLAIWLDKSADEQTQEETLSLCVLARSYDIVNEDIANKPTKFVLKPADGSELAIDAGAWYRLTVKATKVVDHADFAMIPGFRIFVNGKAMKAVAAPVGAGMAEAIGALLSQENAGLIANNELFPSLQTMGNGGDPATLQAVGFKGSGAIDDLKITDENPIPPASESVPVTGVTLSQTTAEITVGGDTLTLTATVAPENATDKTVKWTTSDETIATVVDGVVTAVAAGEVTITAKAGDQSATCKVTVNPAAKQYPEYIAEADKKKYDAWVSAYSVTDRVDTGKALQAAYLLNVAPADAEDETKKFAITSITVDAAGNVTVVASKKNSKGLEFNGEVEILGATALEGPWAAKAAGHKFFKAVLK